MKISRPSCFLLLAAFLALAAVPAARAQLAGQAVRGFRLPEYNPDGTLRQNLFGETATLLEGGLLQLTGLKIEFFNHGVLSARATADECALDQANKRAASRTHIRIVTDKGILSGDGFAWNGENEQFQIFENVRVVIDSSAEGDYAKRLAAPSANSSTNATATPTETP
jgi:hypothetical protein